LIGDFRLAAAAGTIDTPSLRDHRENRMIC